jgi:hypothetical protein
MSLAPGSRLGVYEVRTQIGVERNKKEAISPK